ncbi:MAG: hypothetical protein VW258_08085 [Thalassolituus sp.]
MADVTNLTLYPVGTGSLAPLARNAGDFDELVNSTDETVTTRAGLELKTWTQIQTESETTTTDEIWTGTAVTSLDLTTLPGGYPGDGLYLVTTAGAVVGLLHFMEGEHCYTTINSGTNATEIYKDASDVLKADGTNFTRVRRFRP